MGVVLIMKKTSVKTVSAFLGILLILLSFPLFTACREDMVPNAYVDGGFDFAIVLDGERYIPCEEIYWRVENYDSLERVGNVYIISTFGVLSGSAYIYRMKDMPILYEFKEYNSFFFLESQYDECLTFMKNLQWSETVFYPLWINTEKNVFSQELSKHLLSDHDSSLQQVEFEMESNYIRSFRVRQLDSTGRFSRDAGEILIRAHGDCYYFPNDFQYNSTKTFYPTGEVYDQRTETIYKQYQIDSQYWEEILELS